MRKLIVVLVTFIGGAYFLFEFLTPASWFGADNPLTTILPIATNLVIVLGTMAFLLGPINLARSSLITLARRRAGGFQAGVFLVCFVVGLVVQAAHYYATEQSQAAQVTAQATQPGAGATAADDAAAAEETAEVPAAGTPAARPFATQVFDLLFTGLVMAFGAASIALLAFYLVSAAFRSFRFQNLDAAVMMITATIVLIGLAPLGDLLFNRLPDWLQPVIWARWVLDVPNTAVQRAVAIGAAAGAFAVGTRLWLSVGTRTE